MSSQDSATLARALIANESSDTTPKFWTMNHHRIVPIATKLARVLEPDERISFYRLYLRHAKTAPAVPQGEIPLLIEGYSQLVLEMTGHEPLPFPQLVGLYLFGFDKAGALSDGGLETAKDLKTRLKTLTQCQKYTSLPGQRAKAEKFRPFISEAPRLLEVLQHTAYLGLPEPEGESFNLVNLTFWAMMLTVALAPATRIRLVRDLATVPPDTPRQQKFLSNLHRTLGALMSEVGTEESVCRALFETLNAQQAASQKTGDAMALAQALGLDIAESTDWEILVAIPERDSGRSWYHPLSLRLRMRPSRSFDWMVEYRHSTKGTFTQRPGGVGSNDAGIPPLDGLTSFPAWLHSLSEVHGLHYDTDAIQVSCGRKRADKKRISDWVLAYAP